MGKATTARGACGVLLAALVAACGGAGRGPSSASSPAPAASSTYASAHFVFHYTPLDAGSIASTAAAVEGEHARIVGDLGVSGMPAVDVTLHADQAALQAAVRPIVGPIPSFATGLVTSPTQIHMVSPNAPGTGSYSRMVSNLVHEFAHCVSLRVRPDFANNPRWLWESVAIYEARQRVDLGSVSYMAAHAPPSFAALDSIADTRVYDVGYSIGEFVVERWGGEALAALVAARGDTAAVLGLPLADFEREWFAFVRERYEL